MNRYSASRITILASSLFSEGGDWRSIYFLAKQLEARGEPVVLVHVGGKRGLRQTCASGLYSPRLLVNGLGTLMRWPVLIVCLLRRDVRIYLHETDYVLDQFQRDSPLRYQIVSRILRRCCLLCVSKKAEAHYRHRFSSSCTYVVYECPGDLSPPRLDSDRRHIVMVGSICERKGVELFSKVADLAAVSNPKWQFHWIGGRASVNDLYLSPRVIWHGWQWNPSAFVSQCDVFFLSSSDDPCPLAALEALHMGKKCVAYIGTGTAELISGNNHHSVFVDYTPSAAIACLRQAFSWNSSDPETSALSPLPLTLPSAYIDQCLQALHLD